MTVTRDGWAVITGATSGIGLQFAHSFAAEGAPLLIGGRRQQLLEQRRNELLSRGAREVKLIVGDLSDESVIGEFEAFLRNTRCDVLCNNAGFGQNGAIGTLPTGELLSMQRVLAEVPLRLCNAALAGMRERRFGLVINVGSLAGSVAVPEAATYVAAKAFIERLSESMALENLSFGVVIQALTPGFVKTDFHRDVTDYRARQKSRGLVRWLDSHDVVATSLRRAGKARERLATGASRVPPRRLVVVVPGLSYQLLSGVSRFIPRRFAYRAALKREPM